MYRDQIKVLTKQGIPYRKMLGASTGKYSKLIVSNILTAQLQKMLNVTWSKNNGHPSNSV